MREGLFIKRNVDKWNTYQHEPTQDPDELADRFVTVADDLAYARTFYPNSRVTRWVNSLAAHMYQRIFRNKPAPLTRLFRFWKFDLPLLFHKHHPVLLFTFLLFSGVVALAVLGATQDVHFVRNILGDGYVEMTERNIREGDPFGVYRDENPFTMFVRIAMNNSFVALIQVMGGLTLGIATLFSIWQNGMMLGAFQFLFFSRGLGLESILTIWIHGTIEILSIVVASSAGFIIARSILFPGTYSRMQSSRTGVYDALRIMLVLIPLFILASFFESYVTHLMSTHVASDGKKGLPLWGSLVILGGSLSFMLWYFVFYPIRLWKKQQAAINSNHAG